MIGSILLLLMNILLGLATIINATIVVVKSFRKGENGFASLSGYFQHSATNLDAYAAGEFKTLWNTIFVKTGGIKFEADGRTISYYLGINAENGTLIRFGRFMVRFLGWFEKEHCAKAVESYNKKIKAN